MQYQYIEPFISTTINVIDEVTQSDISKGNIALVDESALEGDINIVISIRGDSEGNIILNMDTDTALNLSNIMTGEEADSISPYGMDAIAELGNMIAGNATSAINDLGYDLRVEPPRICSLDQLLRLLSGIEVFQIPLFTEYGEITMNIAMVTN